MTGLVITLVAGTDHHPFRRLVTWADQRQQANPEDTVTVQHGYSTGPQVAHGVDLVAPDELEDLLRRSDVVVTHGGPGTIMGARRAGHHPLVVARDPSLGEHVDGHQVQFVAWAAEKDLVHRVMGMDKLDAIIESLGTRGTRTQATESHSTELSATRVAALVADYDPDRATAAPGAFPVVYVVAAGRATAGLVGRALHGVHDVAVVDPGPEAAGLDRSLARRAHRRRPGSEARRSLLEFAASRRHLYGRALSDGVTTVLDAGADASTAAALGHDRKIDLRVLQVVRAIDEGVVDRGWMRDGLALESLSRRGIPVVRVSREDLLADPGPALASAWHDLGLPTLDAASVLPVAPGGGLDETSSRLPALAKSLGRPLLLRFGYRRQGL